MTTILVNYWTLQEQIRHNMLTEAEATRHNVEQEKINRANVGVLNAQLQEQIRHNQVLEQRVDYQNASDMLRSSSDVLDSTTKAFKSMASTSVGAAGGFAAAAGFRGLTKPAITQQQLLPQASTSKTGSKLGALAASFGAKATEVFMPMVLLPQFVVNNMPKVGQTSVKY